MGCARVRQRGDDEKRYERALDAEEDVRCIRAG